MNIIKNIKKKLEERSWKGRKEYNNLEKIKNSIDLFPGSLEDYCKLKREEYEIIDNSNNSKYLFYGQPSYTNGKEYLEILEKSN